MDLYSKQTDQFMLDIQYLSDTYREKGSMPVCMQEVLALYALNKGDMTINRFPVRKDVIERVKNFVAAVQPYANDLDTGAEAMKDYEDDYCYFLVFSKVFPKEKKDMRRRKNENKTYKQMGSCRTDFGSFGLQHQGTHRFQE